MADRSLGPAEGSSRPSGPEPDFGNEGIAGSIPALPVVIFPRLRSDSKQEKSSGATQAEAEGMGAAPGKTFLLILRPPTSPIHPWGRQLLSASSPPTGSTSLNKQRAQSSPFPEVVVGRPPRRVVREQHSPLRARFQNVEDSIQQVPRAMYVKAEAIKDGLDPFRFSAHGSEG